MSTTPQPTTANGPSATTGPPSIVTTVNAGPLTTTFKPLGICDTPVDSTQSNVISNGATEKFYLYHPLAQCGPSQVLNGCFPTAFSSAYASIGSNLTATYPVMSPGNICPAGYGASCIMRKSTSSFSPSTVQQWPLLGSEEVAIGCCPNGYTCGSATTDCISIASPAAQSSLVLTYLASDMATCFNPGPSPTLPELGRRNIEGQQRAEYRALRVIYITSNVPESSSAPNDPGPGSTSGSNGLSTATTVAIAISILLAAILCGVIGYIFYDRRRRRAARQQDDDTEADDRIQLKAELDAASPTAFGPNSRVATERSELDAVPMVYEMPDEGSQVYELAENSSPTELGTSRRTSQKHVSMELGKPQPVLVSPSVESPVDPGRRRLSRIETLAKDVSKSRKFSF